MQKLVTTAGLVAGSALCLILAGPASADTATPSPLPTTPATSVAVPSLAPTVAPSAPIVVPAGNAGTTHQGGDATAIALLGAGGVLVAGAGLAAARRRA